MSALGRTDRVRRSGVAGLRGEGVVAALAVGRADRMDRRQIHHVEAHPRHARKAFGRGAERPRLDGAVPEAAGPFRAGEELVPRSHPGPAALDERSEEHTSELQSLMRISYAVFCLK